MKRFDEEVFYSSFHQSKINLVDLISFTQQTIYIEVRNKPEVIQHKNTIQLIITGDKYL